MLPDIPYSSAYPSWIVPEPVKKIAAPKQIVIYFDGAYHYQYKVGGFGIYIEDEQSKAIEIYGNSPEVMGIGSNNVSEWWGIIGAAWWIGNNLDRCQGNEVTIYGDSNMVVEQAKGTWKCKKDHLKGMKKIYDLLCNRFVSKLYSYSIVWIPREKNSKADRLSNLSLNPHSKRNQDHEIDLSSYVPHAESIIRQGTLFPATA